jgi:hypothetical protein
VMESFFSRLKVELMNNSASNTLKATSTTSTQWRCLKFEQDETFNCIYLVQSPIGSNILF